MEPGAAARLPLEARWAESVVGLLDLERANGQGATAVEFSDALAAGLDGQSLAAAAVA